MSLNCKICPKCNINARSNHEVQDQIITSIREDLTANQIDLLSYQKNPRIMPSSLRKLFGSCTLDLKLIKMICSVSIIYWKRFWSRGLVKSRQKNWWESRSHETEVGKKIAVTSTQCTRLFVRVTQSTISNTGLVIKKGEVWRVPSLFTITSSLVICLPSLIHR